MLKTTGTEQPLIICIVDRLWLLLIKSVKLVGVVYTVHTVYTNANVL